MSITTDNYFITLIVYHSLLIAHTPTLITWYRMATMPCTRLQKVGVSMSSSTCCQCSEQGCMRKICSPIPCCTGQPRRVIVVWQVTSLQNSSWTHRTETRCVDARGLCWFQSARSTCVHCLVCTVKHVVTKQVSCGHVYVQSCVMPSESYPTGGKGGQFGNSARCASVLV